MLLSSPTHGDDTSRFAGLALHRRLRGHRLGDHRSQGREHELARPRPDRGAWRDRQGGRGHGHARRGQGPRADERQGVELHRRRRYQGVRELRHRGQDRRGGEADARADQPHRPALRARGRRHSRLLPRRRARVGPGLRLAHRRSRGGHPARLSRGEARHLPGSERHGALDPGRRSDGRHDGDADRAHAAPDGGQGHRPGRSTRADPPHAALGRAQGGAAEAPLQGRAVVEAADAEAAGAFHARQADARQDRGEGARGALSGPVPADRSVRALRRRPRAHEDRRDRDVHAADGERGLAQLAPRVQAVRDAEGRGAQGRLQAAQGACDRRRHHGRRHRRLVRGARHAGEPSGSRRSADQEGARPRQGPVQEAASHAACRRGRRGEADRRSGRQADQACRCGHRGNRRDSST